MPKERVLNNNTRTYKSVRGEVIRPSDASTPTNMLRQDELPKHLQPLKENYEVSIVANEVQTQKRERANRTIRLIADSAIEVTLDVNEKAVEADEIVAARTMREEQRSHVTKAIEEVTKIVFSAIQDGLEEGAKVVNEIADSDPRAQQLADTTIEIDNLTPLERLSGKVRRKK